MNEAEPVLDDGDNDALDAGKCGGALVGSCRAFLA
jgi:hypothetical protein